GGEGGGMRGEKGPRRATPTDLGPARKGRNPAPACSSGRSCPARGRPTPRSRHGAEVLGLRHQGGTMRAKAIRIHETGGAGTRRCEPSEITPPGSGEAHGGSPRVGGGAGRGWSRGGRASGGGGGLRWGWGGRGPAGWRGSAGG